MDLWWLGCARCVREIILVEIFRGTNNFGVDAIRTKDRRDATYKRALEYTDQCAGTGPPSVSGDSVRAEEIDDGSVGDDVLSSSRCTLRGAEAEVGGLDMEKLLHWRGNSFNGMILWLHLPRTK